MDQATPKPLCAKESLDLLNCVADSDFNRDKCLHFLDALRTCVLQQKVKKFSLAEDTQATKASNEKSGIHQN